MGTLIPVPFPDGCETVSELFVGHDGDEPARLVFVASAAARLDAAPSALETEVAGQRVFLAEGELLIRPVVSGRDRPVAIVFQREGDVVFLTTMGVPLAEATAYVEEVLGITQSPVNAHGTLKIGDTLTD